MASSKGRKAKERALRALFGQSRIEVWVSAKTRETLKSLEAKGLSRTQAIERGIDLVAKEVE